MALTSWFRRFLPRREAGWAVIQGDCTEVMRTMPANSVDVVVTDPPYGAEFMGRAWDKFGGGDAQTEHWDSRPDTPFARNAAPRDAGKMAAPSSRMHWLSD